MKREDRTKELAALRAMADEDIDLSDAPELSESQWANAVRGKFYRPLKQQLTVRIDADVLAWLKRGGRGYQSRLNAILRTAMSQTASRRKSRRAK
jgi:uncharacterized protein (DUF4415 family)